MIFSESFPTFVVGLGGERISKFMSIFYIFGQLCYGRITICSVTGKCSEIEYLKLLLRVYLGSSQILSESRKTYWHLLLEWINIDMEYLGRF